MFDYLTLRVPGGYRVTHVNEPGVFFTVTKPNGKMVCDCPEYSQAPKGACEHINQVVEHHRRNQADPAGADHPKLNTTGLSPQATEPADAIGGAQAGKSNGAVVGATPEAPPSGETGFIPPVPPTPPIAGPRLWAEPPRNTGRATPVTRPANGASPRRADPPSAASSLPAIAKSPIAQRLELTFRPDQIKQRDGVAYLDGASVIQRLNDVLGTENWSFRLLGEPKEVREEVVVHGRLTAVMNGQRVVKEDYGAHEHTRKRSDKSIVSFGDTLKSAVTDCIKRCAHQLGVGLHLYSKDGAYRSFRCASPESSLTTVPAPATGAQAGAL